MIVSAARIYCTWATDDDDDDGPPSERRREGGRMRAEEFFGFLWRRLAVGEWGGRKKVR